MKILTSLSFALVLMASTSIAQPVSDTAPAGSEGVAAGSLGEGGLALAGGAALLLIILAASGDDDSSSTTTN